ncbi:MAG: ATP-binding cassette domain-containing protein [Eubacteriales bacterium]|nr:ATP-binding cassette domain-containing protein [Eubacteriales bacterium]
MSILTVKNISHSFGGRTIFEDVSFRLLKGEHVGLIGANGEGKSTFMKIITNKLMPDEGNIEWANRVRVAYMDQHAELIKGQSIRDSLKVAFEYLFDIEKELNETYMKMAEADEKEMDKLMENAATLQDILDMSDFYNIDIKVDEISRGLGLFDLGLERNVDDLSGGQRTKILLARMLLQNPDILLLDEPTNFLDEEHIAWLKDYLLKYENAFILISHDLEFLNSVVNLIYHVENAKLTRYVGNYNEFLRLYEQNKRQLEYAYERQQQEINNLQDFIARNKARVATAGMARARQKKLDKMDIIELSKEKPKPEFRFKQARASDRLIFKTTDLVIGYTEPLCKPLNLLLERGQKIAIVGSNGLGKTTLLRSLLGEINPISGSVEKGANQFIGYFEQEIKEENNKTCIEEIWDEFPSFTQYEVRQALAKCSLTTEHIESKVFVLSGGEQAKVRLCKIMNKETNILILDEPTNHLDKDAKDELKRVLKEYKGTILMVCHEPEFYKDIVTDIWDFKNLTLKIV